MRGIGVRLSRRGKKAAQKSWHNRAKHSEGVENLYNTFVARFEALNKDKLDFFGLANIFCLGQ